MQWKLFWLQGAIAAACCGCIPSVPETAGLKKIGGSAEPVSGLVPVPASSKGTPAPANPLSTPAAAGSSEAPFLDTSKLSDAELDRELAQDTGHLWIVLSNFRLSGDDPFNRKALVDYRLVSGTPRRIDTYYLCFYNKGLAGSPVKMIGEGTVRVHGHPTGTISGEVRQIISKHDVILAKLFKAPPSPSDPDEETEISGYLAVGETQSAAQPPPLPSDTMRATPEQPILIASAKTNNFSGPTKYGSSAADFQIAFQVPLKLTGARQYVIVVSPEGVREEYDASHSILARSFKPYTMGRVTLRTDTFNPILRTRGPYQVFIEGEFFEPGDSTARRVMISNVVSMP